MTANSSRTQIVPCFRCEGFHTHISGILIEGPVKCEEIVPLGAFEISKIPGSWVLVLPVHAALSLTVCSVQVVRPLKVALCTATNLSETSLLCTMNQFKPLHGSFTWFLYMVPLHGSSVWALNCEMKIACVRTV